MSASKTPSTTQGLVPRYPDWSCLSWSFSCSAWSRADGVFLFLESSHISSRPGHSFYLESLLWLFIDFRNTVQKPSKPEKQESGSICGNTLVLNGSPSATCGEGEKSQHCVWTQCMAGCCADCTCPAASCASQAIADTQSMSLFPCQEDRVDLIPT